MSRILVVGSGASGVHFALSLLRQGHTVVMVDAGRARQPAIRAGETVNDLKAGLPDPVAYFLGEDFAALVHSGAGNDYYNKYFAFPPSKSGVYDTPSTLRYEAEGFAPLFSFAQGGLAEAWTAGVYPLNDDELRDFPFAYREIEPHYGEVAKRIGISGCEDDLARFFPHHDHLLPPLRLDRHSEELLAVYERRKGRWAERLGCHVGLSRVATLSVDRGIRKGCVYCGRCLWGCPLESLYTPSLTLRECAQYPQFEYIPDVYVSHFHVNGAGRITGVAINGLQGGPEQEIAAETFVLAAGTLSSSRIFLETVFRATGRIVELSGLMDNRQILIPFVNLRRIGAAHQAESYQYHQIAIGLEGARPEEYIHGQITPIKSTLLHPLLQKLPTDLRTSLLLFRTLRAALGVVNLSLFDRRRAESFVSLRPSDSARRTFVIRYRSTADEPHAIRTAVRRAKSLLRRLGCVAIPGATHVRPMGSSVHYTGTIPMTPQGGSLTVSKDCRSHDFENLYIVDGAVFPFLPAKNITFSQMANAVRVAEAAF